MSRITRCNHCFNPVFEDATVCPHCSAGRTPANKPRILSRGAWIFILTATLLFAAGDAVVRLRQRKFQDLEKNLERVRWAHQEEMSRAFIHAWLRGEGRDAAILAPTGAIEDDIERARTRPDLQPLIPVDRVLGVRFKRTVHKRIDSRGSVLLRPWRVIEMTLANFVVRVSKDGKRFDIMGTLGVSLEGVGSLQVSTVEPVADARKPLPPLPATVPLVDGSWSLAPPSATRR